MQKYEKEILTNKTKKNTSHSLNANKTKYRLCHMRNECVNQMREKVEKGIFIDKLECASQSYSNDFE